MTSSALAESAPFQKTAAKTAVKANAQTITHRTVFFHMIYYPSFALFHNYLTFLLSYQFSFRAATDIGIIYQGGKAAKLMRISGSAAIIVISNEVLYNIENLTNRVMRI